MANTKLVNKDGVVVETAIPAEITQLKHQGFKVQKANTTQAKPAESKPAEHKTQSK